MNYNKQIPPTKKAIPELTKSIQLSLLLVMIGIFSCGRPTGPQDYFPETGTNALYQRSLDLRNQLSVLSIAIRPGYEDLSALAYFRMEKGAHIMSAYLTNGEGGESDVRSQHPPYLAATRRKEATKALHYLDGEPYFLNMPDVVAFRDSAKLRSFWNSDTLRSRLQNLIMQFKPDIILIARDWKATNRNTRQRILQDDLLHAVKDCAKKEPAPETAGTNSQRYWKVNRILIDDGRKKGLKIATEKEHPKWGKTYRRIGEEAAMKYASLSVQRDLWMNEQEKFYRLVYSSSPLTLDEVDEGLTKTHSSRYPWIRRKIIELTDQTMKGKTKRALQQLVAIEDSVNAHLARRVNLPPNEKRTLLNWNLGLENLRCSLLGVEVNYTISDTLITAQQVTVLRFQDVKGIKDSGDTKVYFAGVGKEWAVNESLRRKFPLKLNTEYRILSPKDIDYTYPPGKYPLQPQIYGNSFFFFIMHYGESKENSFVYREKINLSFAPRFVTEVLTPVIRVRKGAHVVVRLTNISRDGVADTIQAVHPIFSSLPNSFRLRTKGSSVVDTMFIGWNKNPDNGTYVVPLKIRGRTYGKFAIRKFNADVDTSQKIGIIPGVTNSATLNALKRLNVPFSVVDLNRPLAKQINVLNTLIVDRRVVTLKPAIRGFKEELTNFVKQGGHLIILAQDAIAWNAYSLWEELQLTATQQLAKDVQLTLDSEHPFLSSPNSISLDELDDWLFLCGYNIISGQMTETTDIPVKAKMSEAPLIISQQVNEGRRTYVDLSLSQQFKDVHPGALRLFANLLSY